MKAVIGADGGTLSLTAAGTMLVVPAGALAQDQTLSIAVATSGYPTLPAGAVLRSSVVAFEPHGEVFAKPATVSIGFSAGPQAMPELITAAPGGAWTSVSGATVNGTAMQATVAHFSFFAVIDPSTDGGVDGSAGTGGTAAGVGGTAGAAATGGAGGTGGAGCAKPEMSLGLIGHGDSNVNFQSGVGALGTDAMYIFSGYTSPATAGGTASQQIYLQAFDPRTGASKGPAQALFSPPTLGFESASFVGKSVDLFGAAVANTGDIALVYQLTNMATSNSALYAAFLGRSGTGDGGVQGLELRNVTLVSSNFTSDKPKVFWSNASQTFVINYATPAPSQVSNTSPLQMSLARYTVNGQSAVGTPAIPLYDTGLSQYHRDLAANGSVGESGSLLGALYVGGSDTPGGVSLTVLDESATPVGTPINVTPGRGRSSWAGVAGTSKGFVCTYLGGQYFVASFVPVSAGSANPDGGIFGISITSLGFPAPAGGWGVADERALADDVGTGGKGGVGVALRLSDGSVAFVYINDDATAYQGPVQAIAPGAMADAMSMTNFNGRFAMSSYAADAHSTQIVATGICP